MKTCRFILAFLIEGITTGAADRDEDEFITIDELHDYASQKVREFQPAMKPEIYAIREGFKIRLAKVAPGDPAQRYRKEVARFIYRGEISFVGRRTLDVLRSRLDLEAAEAEGDRRCCPRTLPHRVPRKAPTISAGVYRATGSGRNDYGGRSRRSAKSSANLRTSQ